MSASGQPITFQKVVIGSNIEYINSVVQLNDEGYLAVGRKKVETINYTYAVRFDKFGDTLWSRTYNREDASSIIQSIDGNYLISCAYGSILKIDVNGNLLIGAGYYDDGLRIRKMVQIDDGSIYACGVYHSNLAFNPYLAKFDTNGNLLWDSVYSNMLSGAFYDMSITNDNCLVIAGTYQTNINLPSYLCLLKTSLDGSEMWRSTLSNFDYLYPRAIMKSENDVIYVACSGSSISKFDADGTFLWKKNYDTLNQTNMTSITASKDNKIVYTGWIDTGGNTVVRIRKIDTNGVNIWNNIIGFDNHVCTPWNIKCTADSGFVVVGRTNFDIDDVYILKIDKLGQINPVIGISNNNEFEASMFYLNQNYPNPFNPVTIIKFKVSGVSVAQTFLSVYDISGKEISSLINAELKPGSYEVSFDASGLSSGVYFYKISAGSFTDVKKMVYLK